MYHQNMLKMYGLLLIPGWQIRELVIIIYDDDREILLRQIDYEQHMIDRDRAQIDIIFQVHLIGGW